MADTHETLRDQIRRLHDTIVAKDAEIERLRAIVDRLPKTADGVPVVPGVDRLWRQMWGGASVGYYWESFIASDSRHLVAASYSTREAAEAALLGVQP